MHRGGPDSQRSEGTGRPHEALGGAFSAGDAAVPGPQWTSA